MDEYAHGSFSHGSALPSKRKYGASSDSWMPGYDDDMDEDRIYGHAQQVASGSSFAVADDSFVDETTSSAVINRQELAARLRELKKSNQGTPQSNHHHATKRLKVMDNRTTAQPQHMYSTASPSLTSARHKGLDNAALHSLNNEFTNIIAQDSLYARTKARYEVIIKDSTNHEREVTDLLRFAREKSDFSLVTNLEGKLFTARERRVRAERLVDGLEKSRQDVEEIVATIAVLDEHVKGVKEKLRELCEQ